MEILVPCSLAESLALGGVGRVVDDGRFLVQNHEGANHSGNPSAAGENRHNQERTTTLVQHSQRRENNR